jgi:hypothetical protein
MAKQEDYEDLDDPIEDDESIDRGDNYDPEDDEDEVDEEIEEVGEDEDEEVEDEEPEEEEVEDPKIPRSRFNQVIKQREEAKERNAWLEAQLEKLIQKQTEVVQSEVQKAPSYDFETAETKYISLIIEGEVQEATRLRKEIDKARRDEMMGIIKEIKDSAEDNAKKQSGVLVEQEKFNNLVENFESKYKFLNAESKEYNEEAVDTVNTLLAGYVAAGKSKSEGLRLAVQKVAPLYTKVADSKPTLGNKRKVEAGKKAAQAANSQPSKTKSVSTKAVDRESVDVFKISEKDFAKLTAKEKSILRGD